MFSSLDKKRLFIFLAVTFGLSWLTALYLALNGGLANSPELAEGTGLTLATALLATVYMWGPAFGHAAARLATKEGWQGAMLKPNFKTGWKSYLVAWLLPLIFVLAGAAVYFLFFPSHFDGTLELLRREAALQNVDLNITQAWQFIAAQVGMALLLSPLLNIFSTFGEEFGWRAYLLPKLQPLGAKKAALVSGLVWGVWHWPLIAMGYNYGFNYPAFPLAGMLAMALMTCALGVVFAWLALRANAVWPAALGHAMINGLGALAFLMLKAEPVALLGPSVNGLLGVIPLTLAAGYILTRPGWLEPSA